MGFRFEHPDTGHEVDVDWYEPTGALAVRAQAPWHAGAMDEEVERVLAARDAHIAELGRSTCALLLEQFPDAVVTVDGNDIGFGTGTGYKGLVFTVAPAKAHVTLGIAGGAGLPDPAGLMEGSGKVHRHIKLRTPKDLDSPELRRLLAAALAARRPQDGSGGIA
ncbi:DUF1801 domain-containing protein [Streptomyces sp. NPDC001970]